jgi:hypothetical protein
MGLPINQMRPAGQSRSRLHDLVIERVCAYGEAAGQLVDHSLVCNTEYLKLGLMDLLDEAGCDYLLHSQVVGAAVSQGRLVGALLATKAGLTRVEAGAFVEATGDADLAFFAGAETMKGRDDDGFLSPMTLCFIIGNVDVDGARAYAEQDGSFQALVEKARAKYPLLPDSMVLEKGPFPLHHHVVINHGGTRRRGVLDGSDARDMTEAERYSRHQIAQIVAALREFGGPAFAQAQLAASGAQVGVRETRRVKGDYVLTEEDALSGRRFADAVAWRSGWLDIGWVRWEAMQVHDVPYRALLPEQVDGLLVAGRCISATHVAASAGKSMGNCLATGHAAGLAAALSVRAGCTPRALPVAAVQQALRKDGVDLQWAGANRP